MVHLFSHKLVILLSHLRIASVEDFLQEGGRVSNETDVLLIALSRSEAEALRDFEPGELILRKCNSPVELLQVDWVHELEVGLFLVDLEILGQLSELNCFVQRLQVTLKLQLLLVLEGLSGRPLP